MNVKEFENRRWTREDQKICFRHRAALDLIAKQSPMNVLDLGCGDGLLLTLLKDKGIVGEGVDISDKAIEKAKAKGLKVSVFDFGTGRQLPFSSGSFDTTIMLDVLEHIYAPDKLLKEAIRVSSHSVIVGVPNFNSLPARLQVLLGRVPENNRPHKGHIYWFNYAGLKNLAHNNGLTFSDLRVNTIMESRTIIGPLFKLLAKTLPSIFALSFVVRISNPQR